MLKGGVAGLLLVAHQVTGPLLADGWTKSVTVERLFSPQHCIS